MRDERYVSYELMSSSEERIGLKSGWFLTVMPYSVSIPITFWIAMTPPDLARASWGEGTDGGRERRYAPPRRQPYRYWPVLMTRSTARCLSFVSPISGFTYTMRSPFLPAILAQSSGLVVLGRSSFSLNSS